MSESSDSGALSDLALQNELESFDDEIEEINTRLKAAKKQFREFKRVEERIDSESVVQICRCDLELKLIERKKKFMEEKKITREMLNKLRSGSYFMGEIGQSYIDLAKSVISDKASGKDIENHDFYKEKFFFDLFYFGAYQFRISAFELENLPEEIFSLAGKEQMENILDPFFGKVPLIRFGDKLQYLSESQLRRLYDDIKKQFKEVAKSNINFPPESPIYKFLTETLPDLEMQEQQRNKEELKDLAKDLATSCCEIC